MPGPAQLGIVDLVVLLVVLGSVVGALRRRSGLIAALASGVGAALICWLGAAAWVVWGPASLSRPVLQSLVFTQVPLPVHAMNQAGQLVDRLVSLQ